jgi:SagB-type dehydrogenase family enzyme
MFNDPVETVFHYHKETKHHFYRYARSLGYLDWANQPDPFRRFEGAPVIPLPFMMEDDSPPYNSLYEIGSVPPKEVSLQTVAQLFEFSLALSAWKEYRGTRWALRINPSSGNLHPTEGYLVINLESNPMVCHYTPEIHSLEVRARFSQQNWHSMMEEFPAGSFLVGLSSVHWREAWKYGERAFRYCQHDIGHALAAYRFSAAMLGWQLVHLQDLGDKEISRILGLDRELDFAGAEREHPDLLAVVIPDQTKTSVPLSLTSGLSEWVIDGMWQGRANKLSEDHVEWEIIDLVSAACEKPHTNLGLRITDSRLKNEKQVSSAQSASRIIFQRRSAVALDGITEIHSADFYRALARTMPGNIVDCPPSIHLCLFVHRIYELLPGLYILARSPEKLESLRAAMKPDFLWQKPPECPGDLPLFFLQEGNCQRLASQVSCGQDIAGKGAFSLGMVAEFEEPIRHYGSWFYRRLFWETGMIGQVLYLEAEAIGIRATGIGCYFDDPVHEIFGFSDRKYQSLYHFTMGGPVEDTRLTTLPPYSIEEKRKPQRHKDTKIF